ncbi:MAG TPA: methionyl-tRNA formyltransferase [Candidatus Limnocylindrales bacterium]|nr:methionyl-tRNA formyltransferase [Candidatus Limnocylindrales bacterium]
MTSRVIFLGTPAFAVPSLDALSRLQRAGDVEIVAVITQPDRPGHRGRVTAPPVKETASALGLDVLQPPKLDPAAVRAIIGLRADVLVWAAYGNLIPRALLDAVAQRAVNVHASLLPRWRGAAPIARAIESGDVETGITLMEGTPELDAGPILVQERTPIAPSETAAELTARLADLGAGLLERELPRYLRAELRGTPQDPTGVTVAPKLTTREALIDWERPAEEIARRVRAFSPEPGAHTSINGRRVVITRASVTGGTPSENGTVRVREGVPHIAAGAGWLRLDEVRPAGKQTMSGADWARGARGLDGARAS